MIKFEKVSFEQFWSDCGGNENTSDEWTDNLKIIWENIKLPERSTVGSAGYDFYSPFSCTLNHNEIADFPTGIRCKMDSDVFLSIFPRSGMGFKYQIQLANTVGIVDSDFYMSKGEGDIRLKLVNRGNAPVSIKAGKAVAQGILMHFLVTDDDEAVGIRTGGFGSTDEQSEK